MRHMGPASDYYSMDKHSGQSNGVNGQVHSYISSAPKQSDYIRLSVFTNLRSSFISSELGPELVGVVLGRPWLSG